jgi:hypothetical protein
MMTKISLIKLKCWEFCQRDIFVADYCLILLWMFTRILAAGDKNGKVT